jgi:hypothetical protein
MIKRKTVFEQVPLAIARKIAAEELQRKEARLQNAGRKRKRGDNTAMAIAAVTGETL